MEAHHPYFSGGGAPISHYDYRYFPSQSKRPDSQVALGESEENQRPATLLSALGARGGNSAGTVTGCFHSGRRSQ